MPCTFPMKKGVRRQLDDFDAVRLQSEGAPDAADGMAAQSAALGHGAGAPMGRVPGVVSDVSVITRSTSSSERTGVDRCAVRPSGRTVSVPGTESATCPPFRRKPPGRPPPRCRSGLRHNPEPSCPERRGQACLRATNLRFQGFPFGVVQNHRWNRPSNHHRCLHLRYSPGGDLIAATITPSFSYTMLEPSRYSEQQVQWSSCCELGDSLQSGRINSFACIQAPEARYLQPHVNGNVL